MSVRLLFKAVGANYAQVQVLLIHTMVGGTTCHILFFLKVVSSFVSSLGLIPFSKNVFSHMLLASLLPRGFILATCWDKHFDMHQ